MMISKKKKLVIILTILASGFLLRFYVARVPFFVDDATDWIRIVNDISIKIPGLYIPLFGSYHGPLTVYLLKISSFVFGKSMLGWRMLHIIFSTLNLLLIYKLVKDGLGEKEAIIALMLAAWNIYFIYHIPDGTQETFLIFLNTALIFNFWKAIRTKKGIYMITTGILIGLGLLTKELILLITPAFFIFLILYKDNKIWFFRKELYAGVFIAIFIALPYIYWDYSHGWLHLRRGLANESGFNQISFFHFSPSVLYLYLGALFLHFPSSSLIFWHSAEELKNSVYLFYTDYGYQCMNPLIGLVTLAGIIFCIKKRELFVRYILLILGVIVIISLVILKAEPRIYSAVFIPSFVSASVILTYISKKNMAGKILVAFILSCVFLDTLLYVLRIDKHCYSTKYNFVRYPSIGRSINLNKLSKGFISLSYKYKPTLVIFPEEELDSLGNYFTAYSGIKTIDCLPENKYLHYTQEDMERILVFFAYSKSDVSGYIKWAENNGYNIMPVKHEALMLPGNSRESIEARVLFIYRKRNANGNIPDIDGLIKISNP